MSIEHPPRPTASPGEEIDLIERRIAALTEETAMIAVQLSDPDKRDDDGRRLSYLEYASWRRSALFAKTRKEAQVRRLRLERKQLLRAGLARVRDGADTAEWHLGRLTRALTPRALRGDLTEEELLALEAAKDFLRRTFGENALGGI